MLADSPVDFVALPKDKPAYQKLVRLLSLGKRRAQKGECLLYLRDMLEWADGSILIALPQGMEQKGGSDRPYHPDAPPLSRPCVHGCCPAL